jgi:hypothetical protein
VAAVVGLCVASLAAPRDANAQPRLDVTVSGGWWNGYDLGRHRAELTGPQAPTGTPVTLFDSDVSVRSGPAAELRVGWRLFRGVYAEATGGFGANTLEARVTNDIEQAPSITVSSTLSQITIEGGAIVELASLRLGSGQLVPFAGGGGGYLRQLHEDRVLIVTGSTLYAAGGVKWRSAAAQPRGLLQRLVVRGDVRFVSRSPGVDIEDERRNYITVSAGLGLRLF